MNKCAPTWIGLGERVHIQQVSVGSEMKRSENSAFGKRIQEKTLTKK